MKNGERLKVKGRAEGKKNATDPPADAPIMVRLPDFHYIVILIMLHVIRSFCPEFSSS